MTETETTGFESELLRYPVMCVAMIPVVIHILILIQFGSRMFYMNMYEPKHLLDNLLYPPLEVMKGTTSLSRF